MISLLLPIAFFHRSATVYFYTLDVKVCARRETTTRLSLLKNLFSAYPGFLGTKHAMFVTHSSGNYQRDWGKLKLQKKTLVKVRRKVYCFNSLPLMEYPHKDSHNAKPRARSMDLYLFTSVE